MVHDNHLYNLMNQLTVEQRGLWRIEKEYMNDSKGCSECDEFWAKMKKDKEEHVNELTAMLKKHLT